MEAHPVPQNIIDVEFKLFGSFTLSQFAKILVGSLIGVGIFFLNFNPLIKFPLIGIVVVLGFGLAIVPNLGVLLKGLLRSVFISPRYVWIKTPSIPELLMPKVVQKNQVAIDTNDAALSKRKLSIDEIPLADDDFNSSVITNDAGETKEVFLKMYDAVYGTNHYNATVEKEEEKIKFQDTQSSKSFASQFLNKAFQSFDISLLNPINKKPKTKEEYLSELNLLKSELDQLDPLKEIDQDRRKGIVEKMDALYSEYKKIIGVDSPEILQNDPAKISATKTGKVLNGIIVSRLDQPIPDAEIYLKNTFFNKTYKTISLENGRFSTNIPIPQGDYEIKVIKPGIKFHSYNIKITPKKPPSYKFREK